MRSCLVQSERRVRWHCLLECVSLFVHYTLYIHSCADKPRHVSMIETHGYRRHHHNRHHHIITKYV